jgi:hypothetical protein
MAVPKQGEQVKENPKVQLVLDGRKLVMYDCKFAMNDSALKLF